MTTYSKVNLLNLTLNIRITALKRVLWTRIKIWQKEWMFMLWLRLITIWKMKTFRCMSHWEILAEWRKIVLKFKSQFWGKEVFKNWIRWLLMIVSLKKMCLWEEVWDKLENKHMLRLMIIFLFQIYRIKLMEMKWL
jgi:hypothetical protein